MGPPISTHFHCFAAISTGSLPTPNHVGLQGPSRDPPRASTGLPLPDTSGHWACASGRFPNSRKYVSVGGVGGVRAHLREDTRGPSTNKRAVIPQREILDQGEALKLEKSTNNIYVLILILVHLGKQMGGVQASKEVSDFPKAFVWSSENRSFHNTIRFRIITRRGRCGGSCLAPETQKG